MNIARNNIDFGLALCVAKTGKRIARAGWNGKCMFVFQRPADSIYPDFIANIKSLPQSVKDFYTAKGRGAAAVEFTAYLCMKAADDSIVNGWLPSQTDMLATDWLILD